MREMTWDPTSDDAACPTPSRRRGLPWIRLGLAGTLVAVCALAGLGLRCDSMPGADFLALLSMVAVLTPTALGSLAASLLACVRRDWRRARMEAGIGALLMLTMPVALWAMLSLAPECQCRDDGC